MSLTAKRIIIAVITVFSICACATTGIFLSGNWAKFISMFDLHKSDLLTSSTTEKVNDSAAVVLNIPAEKPETIKAVWLKAGTDFVYANQSEQAVKNSIDTI